MDFLERYEQWLSASELTDAERARLSAMTDAEADRWSDLILVGFPRFHHSRASSWRRPPSPRRKPRCCR